MGNSLDLSQYPSNAHSDAAKKAQNTGKNIQPIEPTGKIETRKKSFGRRLFETFFADDITNVKDYIIKDVIVPGIKDTVSTTLHNAVDMTIHGTTSQRRRGGSVAGGLRDYTKYSKDPRDAVKDHKKKSSQYSSKDDIDLDDLWFEIRGDAETVRDDMLDILEEYETVSVSDLKEILKKVLEGIKIPVEFTDNNWGWSDLSAAKVMPAHGGGYILKLPKPEYIK